MTEPQNMTGPAGVEMPADLTSRLQTLLAQLEETPRWSQDVADTALGWLDLAHEAAYADNLPRALDCVRQGMQSPGSTEPTTRLALLRTLATVHASAHDHEAVSAAIADRVHLLRQIGQDHQAEMESQLGPMLLREPESFDASVLTGVVDTERSTDPSDTVLTDALVALAVARVEEQRPTEAVQLLTEALTSLEQRQDAGATISTGQSASVRMFIAHVRLMSREVDEATETAAELLLDRSNRAVRAAMWMVRAVAAHQGTELRQAAEYALQSCEMYANLGVRAGAASAAGLLATVLQISGHDETSVSAWRLAAQQAERGEIAESISLGLALGHQLLEVEDFREAEEVLTGLVRRAETTDEPIALARALVDLGHALRHQDKPERTLEHWDRASQVFAELELYEEAARVLLANGALLSREQRQEDAVARLSEAVQLARKLDDADPGVLSQALHALGHVLSERGDDTGVNLLDEAIQLAKNASADWHHADYTDTRARALWALQEGSAAVSTALNAADLYEASHDRSSAEQSELFAAHVLLEQQKAYEAASLFRLLADEDSTARSVRMAAWLGLAQSLEATGEAEDAVKARLRADELASEEDPGVDT